MALIPKAGKILSLRNLHGSSLLLRPSLHTKLKPPTPVLVRAYKPSTRLSVYPKEGVFQPNSPSQQPTNHIPPDAQQTTYPLQNQPQLQSYQQSSPSPRRFRPVTWFTRTVITLIAFTFGFVNLTSVVLSHFPMPFEPGSSEDHEELQLLAEELDSFPLVQELRNSFSTDHATNEEYGAFKEWVAYRGFSDPTSTSASLERRENMFSTGPLKGSRGLAAQCVFWNEESKVAFVFVNFGEATCGWPGIVHGGAISTVVEETLGRVATENRSEGNMTTKNMNIRFKAKCEPGQWYVVMAQQVDVSPLPDQPPPHVSRLAKDVLGSWQAQALTRQLHDADSEKFDPVEAEAPQSTSVEQNTNPQGTKWVAGEVFCVSELGPSLQHLFTGGSTHAVEPRSEVHSHACAVGAYVVSRDEELQLMPEEF